MIKVYFIIFPTILNVQVAVRRPHTSSQRSRFRILLTRSSLPLTPPARRLQSPHHHVYTSCRHQLPHLTPELLLRLGSRLRSVLRKRKLQVADSHGWPHCHNFSCEQIHKFSHCCQIGHMGTRRAVEKIFMRNNVRYVRCQSFIKHV